MDRLGRKKLMLIGIGGCMVCLALESAIIASFASPLPPHPNKAGISAGIAAL